MKSRPLQFALREIHRLAAHPTSWLVLAGASLLMGMVGPFGTFEMPLGPRLAYWTVVVVITAALGTLVDIVVLSLLPNHWPRPMAAGLGGAVAGLPIALSVWLINLLAFDGVEPSISLPVLAAYCIPIAALVTTVAAGLRQSAPAPVAAPVPAATIRPPLLDRLALPQRGRLLHLAVNDHYVDVTTDRGTTLVLIRLSDAIRETAPVPGLQVHRSHWVALDAVRRSSRQAGKPVLELENGTIVPVSRTFLDAARAAGLLAR
ncbi:LytTR family DNA-binding domain-containing protein [Devosia sp. FKR38]|uniref:LytTR family DNA-binding domain-containing protein n=1 Tax=Devosia sp. FKR38 TaxID=2562312 RepID=UPI0014855747|nr:LytTR family DNA-binding domain-containing protein [Devosia sp. FKR38]